MAAVTGLAIAGLDTFVIEGPYLALRGFLLSFFLSFVGWYTGTAIVHWLVSGLDGRKNEHRSRLWLVTFGASLIVTAFVISYAIFLEKKDEPYTYADISFHFIMIFILATAVRAMVYSAKKAF